MRDDGRRGQTEALGNDTSAPQGPRGGDTSATGGERTPVGAPEVPAGPLPEVLVVPIASAIVAAPGDLTEDFLEAQRGAALLFAFACAEGADAADHALLGGALARLAHASLDGVPANKVLAWCPGAQELARLAVDCYGLARGGR